LFFFVRYFCGVVAGNGKVLRRSVESATLTRHSVFPKLAFIEPNGSEHSVRLNQSVSGET
jgi:hypothetical protein